MNKFLILLTLFLGLKNILTAQNRKRLPNPINSAEYTEYAPSITADGKTLIYQTSQYGIFVNATKKVPQIDADGKSTKILDEFETHFFGIFEVTLHPSGEWMSPKSIDPINQYADIQAPVMGGPSVSYDGNTLFFFANFGKNGYGREDIFFSTRENSGWSVPENMGSVINTDSYEGFPSVSPDGKRLYFTREVIGKKVNGKQCYRILVSEKGRNGKWKAPFELPAPVNTGFEKAPRIMADSKTLIFSRIKLDGNTDFDLFKSVLQVDGSWSEPVPLDFINTKKSDLFVSMSPCGDVMYYISNGDIYTTEVPESLRPIKNAIVQGYVLDSVTQLPVKAKLVIKEKQSGDILAVIDNNPNDGRYTALLPFGGDYEISVNLSEYYTKTLNIQSVDLKDCNPLLKDLQLIKLPIEQALLTQAAANETPIIVPKPEIQKPSEPILAKDIPAKITPNSIGNQPVLTVKPTTDSVVKEAVSVTKVEPELPKEIRKITPKVIEELELVADTPEAQSEKISKEGVKSLDSKEISQLALILVIVNKETGEYIVDPTFDFTNKKGEKIELKPQKNGSEYYFKVDAGDGFGIVVNAPNYVPFSAKIPTIETDKKVTLKLAPQQLSYLNITFSDAETGILLNGKCVIVSKKSSDSTIINVVSGKARLLLKQNDVITVKARVDKYLELTQALKIEIPENGSKIYDLDLKLVANQYFIELQATNIETGNAIPNAIFQVLDVKGSKILELKANTEGKAKGELPNLGNYTVKCIAEDFKDSEQQMTDIKHNTRVLFKSVSNKKKIYELKVFVFDELTKEEINPTANVNGVDFGKAPFFVKGEESAIFDINLNGEGVKDARSKMAFNDSLIRRVSVNLYVKRNNYTFYFKASNRKTKDLVKQSTFKIIESISRQEVQKVGDDGLFQASLETNKTYSLQIKAEGFKEFVSRINPVSWVSEGEYERNFYLDAEEIVKQTPKLEESSTPIIIKTATFGNIEKGKSITLKNVYFDQSSPVLKKESFPELDQLIKILVDNPTLKIEIKGHTDNVGDFNLNVKLSKDRCDSVIEYLVKNKIEKLRLQATGRGSLDPISVNNTEENRQKNRRVEFVVL